MNELKEVIKHLEFILDITESNLTEDIEKLKIVNKHLEAINYTRCCTELICDNCDGAGGKNFTEGFLKCPKCNGSGKN